METESTSENVESPSITSTVSVRKGRTKKSVVWNHFVYVDNDDGNNSRAKCIHCGKIYACDTLKNGTSSLKKHIRICAKLLTSLDVKQKTLSFQNINNKGQQHSGFSVATCRELLAKMIIKDELSMKFVEGEGFKEYSQYLEPRFFIPFRFTVAHDIFDLYGKEKEKLKEYFRTTSQRVCLTIDIQTSDQNLNYMVLTAHYIDSDWTMHKKILNFCLIADHKGETIGREVERCLFEWGIKKVLTVTVDNASLNNAAISYLIESVRNWNGLVLDGEYMHMQCFAQILNSIVCDGLKELQEAITRVRTAVKYVRSSVARLQNFKSCVDNVKITCKSSVFLDVSTRWNSTYLMLASAEKFEKAFDKLIEIDSNYVGDLSEECETPPTTTDWANIRELVELLKIFYDTTVSVSTSSHITSAIYFSEVCNLKLVIMEYAECDNPSLRKMAIGMQEKFDKYWGSCEKINFLMYVAAVLDPRCKIQFLQHCLAMLVDNNKATNLVSQVRTVINRLYDQYKLDLGFALSQDYCSTSVATSSFPRQVNSFPHNKIYEMFCNRRNERNTINNRTEVDQYLSEKLEKFSDSEDNLAWWKVNSLKYPILSRIAKDVLGIPISTVPSESAFSVGRRVIESSRSSLSPKTVEALICTQSWIRQAKHNLNNFNDVVDEFDKDFISIDGDSEPIKISEQ